MTGNLAGPAGQLALDLPGAVPDRGTPVDVVSWGLGVESTAYLVEVLTDPARHGVDPARMVVLHAVVGSEWSATLADAERYALPLLADRGVRLVQVARAGRRDTDGIVVLDDSHRARRLHRAGPWTLADESRVSGTVPQLSHRRCSLRFKGWVLDRWLEQNLDGRPYTHVIGYAADEQARAARDLVYATETRTPSHPLIAWGWLRDACSARLLAEWGVRWKKSACVFCPYAGGKSLPHTLARMRAYPAEAVTALLLEAPAVALNPRSVLFGTHSLLDRLQADGNTAALDLFHHELAVRPWSVYEVRRLHFPDKDDSARKATSWRSVRTLFTGDADHARGWLAGAAHRQGRTVSAPGDGYARVWLRHSDPAGPYPKAEHFLVATLAGTETKARATFDEHWRRVCGLEPDLFTAGRFDHAGAA